MISPKFRIIKQTLIPDAVNPTYAYQIEAYNADSGYVYADQVFTFPVGTTGVIQALNAAITDWATTNAADWAAAEEQYIAFVNELGGMDLGPLSLSGDIS